MKRFNHQNYEKLRRRAQATGRLFEDPQFPATWDSVYLDGHENASIEWKRPGEICSDPHLVVGGVHGNDLNQGDVGNCWFVAACASLALEQKLWKHVVPNFEDQEWDADHPEKYAGIFRFRFWRFGEEIEVVIDDCLPTVNGKLVYVHSKQTNEFWSPLLEKAYAKLAGCYEALDAGNTADAFVDFSGGVSESINLETGGYPDDEEKRILLFKNIERAMQHQAMVSCSISSEAGQREARMDCGLVKGHAYGVTALRKVIIKEGFFRDKKLRMIRIRNPWGGKEWNGPWSDGSSEWKNVPEAEKKRIGLDFEDDGEFWMDFKDWCSVYTHVAICRLINTSIFSFQKTWHETKYYGLWDFTSAGGCVNSKESFFKNPQYLFDVRQEDEGMVMVALQQKDKRALKSQGEKSGENMTIGFVIMKVEENRKYRIHTFHETAGTVTYINSRSVFGRFSLKKGRYVLVPSTYDAGVEGDFMLRIFTESDSRLRPLVKGAPSRAPCYRACCSHYPRAVVVVDVKGCDGLEKANTFGGGSDSCVVVQCEGKEFQTPVRKDTLDPVFDTKLMFYVKRPERAELLLQVWNSNVTFNTFLGQVTVNLDVDGETQQYSKELMNRRSKKDQPTKGKITFSVLCSTDLSSV